MRREAGGLRQTLAARSCLGRAAASSVDRGMAPSRKFSRLAAVAMDGMLQARWGHTEGTPLPKVPAQS